MSRVPPRYRCSTPSPHVLTLLPPFPSPPPPQVQIKTSLALYELSRPAQKYRKAYADLLEQLEISRVVYSALSPEAGGNMAASLDEVVAKMARAKVGDACLFSARHCSYPALDPYEFLPLCSLNALPLLCPC